MSGALSDLTKAAACPTATQNVAVNLRNRQKAIKGANYGPLNPAEPNTEYWAGIASRWETTPAEAKKQRCGNCAAFIRTPAMLECISTGLANEPGEDAWATIKAGELGYCEAWDFKCAAGRTCDAWIAGGPVLKDIINETPEVTKGYSPMYRDGHDEEEMYANHGGESEQIDPLDEMLDAYQSFVAMGNAEFADATLALVKEYQALALGVRKTLTKSEHMGFENPVACLSQAYLGMLGVPGAEALRAKTLKLIGLVSETLFVGMSSEAAEKTNYQIAERTPVRREIRSEDGQFCVYSETGRSFGCYPDEQKAQNRLAQIESFVGKSISVEPLEALIEWHDSAHEAVVITPAIKAVHDLVADEIEAGFGIAEPYQLSTDDKLEIVTSAANSFLNKAAPYRYTLGPAYVPGIEDAHGEFADSDTLQKAMWDWVRKGDRTIYLQHSSRPAGEMVEMLTWPFPISTDMTVPGQGVTKQTFPADTPFLGVVWEPWAWELVKAGKLRGYSIGGSAQRIEADLPIAAGVFAKEKDDVPTDMELYNRIKGEAKKKFDVYPSLYANNWLVGEYKRRGGKYKTVEKGDTPGHPFRGNQFSSGKGGGGTGGGNSAAGDKIAGDADKVKSELQSPAMRGQLGDANNYKQSFQITADVKQAGNSLKDSSKSPERQVSGAKVTLESARRRLDSLPNGPAKEKLGTLLSTAEKTVGNL
jgi:hypothetical protein